MRRAAFFLIILVVCLFSLVRVVQALTIDWDQVYPAGGSDYSWNKGGAVSGDGETIIAGISNGRAYISDDSGANWSEAQPAGNTNANWITAAINTDGQKMLVGAYGTGLYLSTNGGDNWTNVGTGIGASKWYGSAMSQDGQVMIAGTDTEGLYMSTDSGSNWSEVVIAGATGATWIPMAVSSNGQKLVAGAYNGRIYRSTDGGDIWSEIQPAGNATQTWLSLAMDASGQTVLAGMDNGRLYRSTNGGDNWQEMTPAGSVNRNWRITHSSSDGEVLFVGASDATGRLYFSTDGGDNWTETQPAGDANHAWTMSGLSSDGDVFLAGINPGRLYVGTVRPAATPALVRWYTFDETTAGSTAVDSRGNGDATPVNAPVPSTDVPVVKFSNPRSISFTTNKYFTLALPVDENMSICSWIKTSTGGTNTNHYQLAVIIESEAGGLDDDWGFGIDSNKKLAFGNGGASDITISGSTVVADGTWKHVCATRNQTTGEVLLYVNGAQDGTGTTSTVILDANPEARIGDGTDGGSNINGNIDDLRIYNYVLSSTQIANLAAGYADINGAPSPTANPSSTSSSSNSSNTSGSTACTSQQPQSSPNLFKVDTESTKATVYFSPVSPASGYVIQYGTTIDASQYGVSFDHSDNSGVVSYPIQALSPNTTYYFRVQAKNGCKTGDWSGVFSAKTKGGGVVSSPVSSVIEKIVEAVVPEKEIEIISSDLTSEKNNACSYTVKTGDTWWKIAKEALGEGEKFKELQELNTLENTTLNVGQTLQLPCDDKPETMAKAQQELTQQGSKLQVKVLDDNNTPVKGAQVTLHSKVQVTTTDENGIAHFENVEPGEHTVLLAYDGYNGEQKLTVDGTQKEQTLTLQVKMNNGFSSPIVMSVIGILVAIILGLVLFIFRKRVKIFSPTIK